MTITEIAIKRPSLIIVFFAILIIGGLFTYGKLNIMLMPEMSKPMITIMTLYPGAAPSEVESSVTKKIEDEISGLENITDISAKSFENASLIMITFKHGSDLNLATQDAQRKIDNVRKDLPEDILSPTISKVSPSDMPILYIAANSNMPPRKFNTYVEDKILPQIEQIKGVASIDLLGSEEREIKINIDSEKLKFYKLSILQITQSIKRENLEFPTGNIKNNLQEIIVKMTTKYESLSQIENLVIYTSPQGGSVYLKDVATVIDGTKETENISRYNKKPGLCLQIKKQKDGNTVEISKIVHEKLAAIEKSNIDKGIKFITIDDSSDFTLEAIDAVTHDLFIAILLVSVIMLLFLHSIRNAIIVMVSIPASLISTFLFMYLFGFSLNLMTLLAMSLVIGILVDDSIVVLENIYRHMEMGKDKIKATIEGRQEIGFSALSITLVDVVVFVPIMFVKSTIADVLIQYSMVVVCSTLMSLVVCFTLTPFLVSRFGKLVHLKKSNIFQRFLIAFEEKLDVFTKKYVRLVDWSLSHKVISLSIIILMFVGTGIIMGMNLLGQELVAQGDRGRFKIIAEFDKGTSLQQNEKITKLIENKILSDEVISSVFSNIGGPTSGFGGTGLGSKNVSELTVQLKQNIDTLNTEKYMMNLRKELFSEFCGIKFSTSVIGIMNGGQAPIQLVLSSENTDLLMSEAARIEKMLQSIDGTNDKNISVKEGNPEIHVSLDKEKMALLGLNTLTIGASLQNALSGNDDSKFSVNKNEYDINISLDDKNRQNIENIKNLSFINNKGQSIHLTQFGTVKQSSGPSVLERKNRRNSVTISSNVIGISSGAVSQEIMRLIEQQPINPMVSMSWDGEIKDQAESFGALGIALMASLILVYLIMVALYDNFIYPLVVLFSIPVSLIGALLALNLTLSSMSVFTMLGIIMLLGLVMKNAILIVDFTNQLKEEGVHFREALLKAVDTRMRPILMTTCAMVIGMLPIALASGAGSEWKNGLAWVLIGGLTSSMILTIVLVPIMYYCVDRIKEKFGSKKEAKAEELVMELTT